MFVAVASLRSFARAARSLGRSPQSATRSVAALEARLKTRLLARSTRAVSLTADGARHLDRARTLVAEFDAIESPEIGPLRGVLVVTAPVLFGQMHVVRAVLEMTEAHPDLDVRLLLFDRVVSLADEGIDVAVRIGALPDSSLRARLVGHVRSVVCASPEYLDRAGRPRAPESLAKHACIAFTATTPIADRWSFGKESVSVRPRLTVNSGQAAIDAAVSGHGIVRAFSYQVQPLVDRGKLEIVLRSHEPEPSPVHVVQLAGSPARAATAFAELAVSRLSRALKGS